MPLPKLVRSFMFLVLVTLGATEQPNDIVDTCRAHTNALNFCAVKHGAHDLVCQNLRQLREQACSAVNLGEGVDGLDTSPELPPNPAKCAGDAQSQTDFIGTLDCGRSYASKTDWRAHWFLDREVIKANPRHWNQGKNCLDNLSSGMFLATINPGQLACTSFNTAMAFASQTTVLKAKVINRLKGFLTKPFITHPNKAAKNTGVFGFKRMQCIGRTCDVFKVGVCVKCPVDIFNGKFQSETTAREISKFVDCCVMGRQKWKEIGPSGWARGDELDCPSEMHGKGAFTQNNTKSSEIREDYKCDEDGQRMADAVILAA